MFYEGLRLWEAHLYVFYVSGRLSRGRMCNGVVAPGGSAKERPSRAWGEGEGRGERLDLVLRGSEALGGSICRVLRGSEALGGSFVRVLRGGEAFGGLSV